MLKKFDKIIFLISIVLWGIINVSGIHNMFFKEGNNTTILIIKILHFLFLWFFIWVLKRIFINRKSQTVKEGIIIGLSYFIITGIILRLVWPGIWSWDDIHVASNAQIYDLSPWQHFFSGLFQILCLQTIPIVTGVIIIQIFISSLIVGYCVATVSKQLIKNNKKRILLEILLTLTTLFPPVLEYILSGFRMGIYSYIELLLIIVLFNAYYKSEKITLNTLITVIGLTIIVAAWRTEAIYYLICVPIILLFIIRKNGSAYKNYITYIGILFSVVAVLAIGKYNNYLIGSNNYSITATISPVSEMIKKADSEKDKEAIEMVNKVLDVQYIYDNPELTGEGYYWEEGVRKDYTDKDYSEYLKGYIKLAIKYPNILIKTTWDLFLESTGIIVKDGVSMQRTAVGRTSGGALNLFEDKVWRGLKSEYKWALNEDLRETVIREIACFNWEGKVTTLYYIFWNLWIPLGLIMICLLYKLIKREWFTVVLILTILGRVPLIFVTSAAPYIMYYLSVYLISYFISIVFILQSINNRIDKNISK